MEFDDPVIIAMLAAGAASLCLFLVFAIIVCLCMIREKISEEGCGDELCYDDFANGGPFHIGNNSSVFQSYLTGYLDDNTDNSAGRGMELIRHSSSNACYVLELRFMI